MLRRTFSYFLIASAGFPPLNWALPAWEKKETGGLHTGQGIRIAAGVRGLGSWICICVRVKVCAWGRGGGVNPQL